MVAGDGSGGGGSRAGGRHGEVDWSLKRMGSGFFSFRFLLFFLASVTKGTNEGLRCGQNRAEQRLNNGVGSSQASSHKGYHVRTSRATADRHQHVPSYRPHSHPHKERVFLSLSLSHTQAELEAPTVQSPGRTHTLMVFKARILRGWNRVPPSRGAGLFPSRSVCRLPQTLWKAPDSARPFMGYPGPGR